MSNKTSGPPPPPLCCSSCWTCWTCFWGCLTSGGGGTAITAFGGTHGAACCTNTAVISCHLLFLSKKAFITSLISSNISSISLAVQLSFDPGWPLWQPVPGPLGHLLFQLNSRIRSLNSMLNCCFLDIFLHDFGAVLALLAVLEVGSCLS